MHQPARKPKLLKDYAPPDYLIEEVELDVALDPKATRVAAKLRLRPNPKVATGGRPLVLDGEGLTLQSLALNGKPLSPQDYELKETSLSIAAVPAQPFTLEIVTLCDPDANTALSGLYRSRGTYCTQCEPEGFRRITYFIDRPDVLAVYTVRIEADRASIPVLLSNGNPIAHGDIPGTGRHFAIWHDPFPKPSYLFALVGGDLACVPDSFVTASGRKVALAIYVEPGKEDRCAWAMESLKRAMRWDEERFGREYDLDVFNIVAVSDFNMGAMENKGLNIFNDKLVLARPDTASDADYASIEGVIAHEYFHNWTGDRVTCRDWFQLCLKEGLDRLPRSGVHRRYPRRAGRAHRRRAHAEDPSISRGCRAPRSSRAARLLYRDQQLLYGDRLREGRRGLPHVADPARPRRLPQRPRPLFRAPRRRGRDGRGLRRGDGRRLGPRSLSIHALVHPKRDARACLLARLRSRMPRPRGSP